MRNILMAGAIALFSTAASAEIIGGVDTAFKMFGPNHKVVVERFDDPLVNNASCYVSYPKTGGFTGMIGVAEDPSRFSIACRATGKLEITGNIPEEFTEVFSQKTSILFKEMRVSRMWDREKNVIVYLVWSTRLIDGSPFNSVTAIAIDQ